MGRALLSKALIQLSAGGWGCTPLGSCLAWGNPALGPRGSMIGLMANSRRVHAKGDLPGPPSPWWAPADPHRHRRPCNTSREFWFSLLWGHCSSLWVLVRAKFYLCPPRLESLFPSVLWEAYNQTPLALKARFPGDSQSLCRVPRLGSLMWGSEPSQQCENLFGIIVLQSVGHPPNGYGFDFIVIAPLLPSHCGFEYGVYFLGGFEYGVYCDCSPSTISLWLWIWGIFFWCLWIWGIFFWWVPVSSCHGCPTVSCNFGASAGGDENTSYSTVLNWKSLPLGWVTFFFVFELQDFFIYTWY